MSKPLKKKIAKKSPARARTAGTTPVTPKESHYVYSFGDGKADGNGSMKPLLGGKGAGLHEMTRIGSSGSSGIHYYHRSMHLLLR